MYVSRSGSGIAGPGLEALRSEVRVRGPENVAGQWTV